MTLEQHNAGVHCSGISVQKNHFSFSSLSNSC